MTNQHIKVLDLIDNNFNIRRLSHSYNNELVLENITCSFSKGAFVALLGTSGCGKTTLLKCAAGLIKLNSGSITLDGVNPEEARRNGKIGFAFQSPKLLPWRTALENVILPLEILNLSNKSKEITYARDLLDLVGLKDDINKLPKELSGGMQQRVGLARALVTKPSYLFLDEPFGALDPTTRDELNEKVREIWEQLKLTIMFVTHSVEEAVFLADQVVMLSSRPAKMKDTINIELGNSRNYATRVKKEFMDYTIKIRDIMRTR